MRPFTIGVVVIALQAIGCGDDKSTATEDIDYTDGLQSGIDRRKRSRNLNPNKNNGPPPPPKTSNSDKLTPEQAKAFKEVLRKYLTPLIFIKKIILDL